MGGNILQRTDGKVAAVGINRPEKKNALTAAMYSDLADALEAAESDTDVRVIVLHGSDDCFTAGNDLTDFASDPPTGATSPVYRFLDKLSRAEKPIIAAVAGHAVGIGTTALLHCDLVLASPTARFSVPFTDLGLCPEAGSSVLLPAAIGIRRAFEMLLLGSALTAAEAVDAGLINRVVNDGSVIQNALELAAQLAAKPPAAVRLTKKMLKDPMRALVSETMDAEAVQFVERLRSPEAREAFAAFAEKRAPNFDDLPQP